MSHGANKISNARLIYQDGAAASSDFPLSNSENFVPGAEVEILAGASGEEKSLFTGIVVKHALKIREYTAPELIVDCQHAAVKMTVGMKSAYFLDQTDSDVLKQIIGAYDVDVDVAATTPSHQQIVQYDSNDWDFCLLRASVNGQLVLLRDNQLKIQLPVATGEAKVMLQYGSTILELDVEVDARDQYSGIKGLVWDSVNQEVIEKEAVNPELDPPGNLAPSDLAEVLAKEASTVRFPSVIEEEAQAAVDARWMISQLNQVGARIKCEGMTEVQPGDIVQLDGIGERFNGNAFVTAVRHDFDLVQGWKTSLQVGGIRHLFDDSLADLCKPEQPLVPPVSGLKTGIVLSNEDPDGEFRVKVALPMVGLDGDGIWARVATLDAGSSRGTFFQPEVSDEVVVGFFDDDPRQAVIVGMLHSSAKPAPFEPSDDNHDKGYVSRSEMKLHFDDDKTAITLSTPGGNNLLMSEDEGSVVLADENGNKIEMNADGIKFESAAAIEFVAATEVSMEAATDVGLKAGAELKLESSAGSELSSSAVTQLKGSLVQIN